MKGIVLSIISLIALPAAHCAIRESVGEITQEVSLDIKVGSDSVMKFRVGLFGNEVPITVANFVGICSKKGGLSYDGTPFHRIIPNFMIQGGDITAGDGTGGKSIYGRKFEDENFSIKHAPHVLSMANSGPNTNGSQFFITVAETPWLDGKHVVFGKILDDASQLMKIEAVGASTGQPREPVTLVKCTVEKTLKQA